MASLLYDLYEGLPKVPAMAHPSFEEYQNGLKRWQQRWPERISVDERGRSLEGRPILMARVSDHTVPDDNKQILLLSASHGEGEISPVCGILHFLKWLLSGDPKAEAIRRGLIVISMPIVEVDTYVSNRERGEEKTGNKAGHQFYHVGVWTWDGVPAEHNHPEARAFFEMMEEYRPDAHLDIHGAHWLDFGMAESIGVSTPRINRCFDPTMVTEVERAVDAAGFCTIREEVQAGRLCVATRAGELGPASHHFASMEANWMEPFRIMINPTLLSHHRYHSVSFNTEQYWMGSIVAACRRMAELGLETGFSEFFPGYPNNLVGARNNLLVSAWGDTASRRRGSRMELWNRCGFALMNGVPMVLRNSMLASCATTQAGQRLLGVDPQTGKGSGPETFLGIIQSDQRFNAPALRDFLASYPPTMFAYRSGPIEKDEGLLRHGLALRVCLQYADADIGEVRQNGHLLEQSPTDGYLLHHRQGTVVQVNIPPDKVHDLHVVTIRYEAPPRPLQGFTTQDWESDSTRIIVR